MLTHKNKSPIHKHIQETIYTSFPKGSCSLEYHFPTIHRIADVVYHPLKVIFEVQYSPISLDEVQHRHLDYDSIGYQVIWILHDKTFNFPELKPSENYLQHFPHYFTNINTEGKGSIYDHPSVIVEQQRIHYLEKREIQLFPIFFLEKRMMRKLPYFLKRRNKIFNLHLTNDYTHTYIFNRKIIHDINSSYPYNDFILKRSIFRKILKAYLVFFQFILKKVFF